MFHNNPNTVRKYLAENDLGTTLSRGSRVDRARWNEFLGVEEIVEERFSGMIDVDLITADLKRVFDGSTQGEIEITFTLKGE